VPNRTRLQSELLALLPINSKISLTAISINVIYWHVYVLGLGYFVWPWSPHKHRTSPHISWRHTGVVEGGRETMNFIYCCWCRRSLSTMHRVLSVAMEIQFALLLSCEIFGIVVNNNKRSVLWVCVFVIWHEKRKLLLQQQASKDIYRVAEKSPYTQTIRTSDSIKVYTAQRSTQYSVKWSVGNSVQDSAHVICCSHRIYLFS
jgi:hypothetical protein